jgi:hypothetical protein
MNRTIAKIAQSGVMGVLIFSLFVPHTQAFSSTPFVFITPVARINKAYNPKVLPTGSNRVIGSFTVTTSETLTIKNSTFQIKSNTKSVGKYLTNVRVMSPKGAAYRVVMNADGKGTVADIVTLAPGTYTFNIVADVKKGIPAKTKLQVFLEGSTIKMGTKIKVPFRIPEGRTLPLQNIVVG